MKYQERGVLFDLDNTIVKNVNHNPSKPSNYISSSECMKLIANDFGIPYHLYNNIDGMSRVWNETIDLIKNNKVKIEKEKIDELMKRFNDIFVEEDKKTHKNCKLMPYALETLTELKKDYTVGIVTNTSRIELDTLSEKLLFKSCIHGSVTRDDVEYLKPHPEPILKLKEKLGVKTFKFVGDSPNDVISAKLAGGLSILYNSRKLTDRVILSLEPYAVIDSLKDLVDFINQDFYMR